MRIGIDARIANYSSSGIARYAKGVLAGLRAADRSGLEFSALTAARKRFPLSVERPLGEKRLFTPPHSRLEPLLLPFELRLAKLDLLHCMDFFAAHPRSLRTIYSVHDLFFVRDESLLAPDSRNHYMKLLANLPNAHHVVCISEATRLELLSLTDMSPERVSVIYPGCEPLHEVATNEDVIRARSKFNLPSGCVLFVGTIEPRKNVLRMVEGYARAVHALGRTVLPPFVLVGRDGFRADEIRTKCGKFIPGADVRFLGGVSERELAALYRIATIALFVTGGEGFGFPIVEAMLAGIPVITSNRSASAEVAADSAIKVDPDDPTAIADALITIIAEPIETQAMTSSGLTHAAKFSWRRCGDELCELYRREAA